MARCRIRFGRLCMLFLLISIGLLLRFHRPHRSTMEVEFLTVRDNVRRIMLWPNTEQLPSVLSQALANLSALNQDTCMWPDLNYSTRGRENWDPVLHMFRVSTMTAALTVPGGLNDHAALATAVHCALGVWIREDWQNPNWWWNHIQDPLIATGIMLMLGVDRMTKSEVNAIVNMSYRANWWIKDWGGGANLVWELQVQLYRGLATSNYSAVAQAFQLMWHTVQVQNTTSPGPGIQTDWSYHFHGRQLLSGSYGDAWATNILHFHLATRGTRYAIAQDRIETFARFLTEGDAWLTMGSVWTWGIVGRVIDRGVPVWYTHLFPSEHLRALARDVLDGSIATALREYADRLEHRHDSPPLVGNRHFYISDFQVHRRPNWTAALKMHSIRTIATECYNGENMKGEHVGDGVLNLYTRDAQYGRGEEYENIFAILDWKAINGITVEADVPFNRCPKGPWPMLKTGFVGGVSDGYYGVAAMDTATHNLTAKRTWHFYDDNVIALATGIEDRTTALIQTALVSRILPAANTRTGTVTIQWSNGTRSILADGVYRFSYGLLRPVWIHADGTAWSVLDAYEALLIDCRNKTVNMNQIGPWNFQVSRRLLTVTIVHGRGPTHVPFTYKYMIIPNITVESIAKRWKHYFAIIGRAQAYAYSLNDHAPTHLHGTCDPYLRRASVVLFDQNPFNHISGYYNCSDLALSIYMVTTGGILFLEDSASFTITAAHPTIAVGTLATDINRASVLTSVCTHSDRWRPQKGTRVLVRLPNTGQLLGKSVSVTCKKLL